MPKGKELATKISAPHPQVKPLIKKEWHGILEVLAEFLETPVALIRQVRGPNITVIEKNSSVLNPYELGHETRLHNTQLFCEHVVSEQKKLFVGSIDEQSQWKQSADIDMHMVSYLGLPLLWPNGDAFGTLCVMDTIPHYYTEKQERLFTQMQDIIQTDLLLLEKNLELENLSNSLSYYANTDDLTGILNRRAFIADSNRELQRRQRNGSSACLMMLDLDNFKEINDDFGHQTGDEVLKLFSNTVKSGKRVYDIFGRIGGEEFAILLPETELVAAQEHAERIRTQVDKLLFHKHNQPINITVSIGLYQLEKNDTTILPVLAKADKVLYNAKRSGKNCVVTQS
jgi:diguanylate cyclase (GGDEF)-like protein